MSIPKIYYAALDDYTGATTSLLTFPASQEFPFISASSRYETSSIKNLEGSRRTSQVADGRSYFSFAFKLFNDTFRAQFLAFVTTVRGSRFPFFYSDADDVLYFLRLSLDSNPISIRFFGLNDILVLMLESATNLSYTIPSFPFYTSDGEPFYTVDSEPFIVVEP